MKVRVRKDPFDGTWHKWIVESKTWFSWNYKSSFYASSTDDISSEEAKAKAIRYAQDLTNPTIINVNWKEIK